jgi:hypothetical protein
MAIRKPAAIRGRIAQDRRMISRVNSHLTCQFYLDGVSRKAVVVDISLKGALLSSGFPPSKGACITIILQTPHLEQTLSLEGKVIREGWGLPDHGKMCQFGVLFNHAPLDLFKLIHKMTAKP